VVLETRFVSEVEITIIRSNPTRRIILLLPIDQPGYLPVHKGESYDLMDLERNMYPM
jgi:hypothetical protein